ncbi:MAG: acyl-CoA ligase (AMP-forming), exosortase A system-associated [Planctomycetes bacterium]|nr:acyl-CoA ligase (AMP-forming), exosortase A system-associated [Planctomycetota bacterium]
MTTLLHQLVEEQAARSPAAGALVHGDATLAYGELAGLIARAAGGLAGLGLGRGERVAVWLDKRIETVAASFAASAAGLVFVPVNPVLKPAQVRHILADCGVRALVTAGARLRALAPLLAGCPDLADAVLVDRPAAEDAAAAPGLRLHAWQDLAAAAPAPGWRVIASDLAAILYTSGSTGRPKGVMLSHRNLVAGARSVAAYLGNRADDVLLAALPLSFDAGFSQLTTAFAVGARAVLHNHLLPQDTVAALARHRVTGLTAVPPLWIQLMQAWRPGAGGSLRYLANTGGRMPRELLARLRERMPQARPFLMYGLTEAFRATYLPPEQADVRPDSIGTAIPGAEILVLRPDGTPCAADEPGELVQRGVQVALGYWNDPERTAERFRPLPARALGLPAGLVLPEIAVFSGDTVRRDAEGFLYFVGRSDEMIKTSGYRVSPTEIEEAVYATGLVGECAAFGVSDPALGQRIVVVAAPPPGGAIDEGALRAACARDLPAFQQPSRFVLRPGPLPRNPNGKLDRAALAAGLAAEATP